MGAARKRNGGRGRFEHVVKKAKLADITVSSIPPAMKAAFFAALDRKTKHLHPEHVARKNQSRNLWFAFAQLVIEDGGITDEELEALLTWGAVIADNPTGYEEGEISEQMRALWRAEPPDSEKEQGQE